MTTKVILEFDGRNSAAKSIVNMLQTVGLFKVSFEKTGMEATLSAIEELNNGKGKRHNSVKSLMKDLMDD